MSFLVYVAIVTAVLVAGYLVGYYEGVSSARPGAGHPMPRTTKPYNWEDEDDGA